MTYTKAEPPGERGSVAIYAKRRPAVRTYDGAVWCKIDRTDQYFEVIARSTRESFEPRPRS